MITIEYISAMGIQRKYFSEFRKGFVEEIELELFFTPKFDLENFKTGRKRERIIK